MMKRAMFFYFFGSLATFLLVVVGVLFALGAGINVLADDESKDATLKCFHCGRETQTGRRTCQHCGNELQ